VPASRPRIARPDGRFPLAARFSRTRLTYWLVVLGLAAVTGVAVHLLIDQAAAARARFGDTTTVLVARTALAPGDRLDGRVERRYWPVALRPAGALTRAPARAVATAPIGRGEVLVGARVSGHGRPGAAALLRPGDRAIAVPVAVAGLPLRVGDRVDVLAVFDAAVDADATAPPLADTEPGPVASDAVVVAVGAEAVTVAVDAGEAPALARALGAGTVVLALR
jgi:Flp pilus assembly protein CpaB